METLLEQQRNLHEERERVIDAMVQVTLQKKTTGREIINSDHKQKYLLERYFNGTNRLIELYEDADGFKKNELQDLEEAKEFDNVDKFYKYTFDKFYNKLKQVKDFHKTHHNEISIPLSVEFNQILNLEENATENVVEFSDEEGYGKFLDLHECFALYINLKGMEKIDYITFLTSFDNLHTISKDRKSAPYRKYIENLLQYLIGFLERTKPLLDLESELRKAEEFVLQKWDSGNVKGWPKDINSALTNTGALLNLTPYNSQDELEKLGLDRLKSALSALGLKCGGTLQERAKRLWATKSATSHDSSWVVKTRRGNLEKYKMEMACIEAKIYTLAALLSAQRDATIENVQRKQARANCEMDDSEDDDVEEEVLDSDTDDVPYNPKNIPLDWDGKPIPYWLYKLHGLNLSFPCEICGNFVYKGPKAFEKHFAEWRHAQGMRFLGVPNTAHFANVTQIDDVLALWEKIKIKTKLELWQPEDEDFEDSSGNVINRKLYVDLKRQGLL